MDQPVILCGLGQVGWRVLEYLRAAGIPVVAVDDRCAPNDPRLGDSRLVGGDFRQKDVLEQAGLRNARGVLILSSNDLVNISAVLMVRHFNPAVRVVVRLFNQNLIQRLGKAVANVYALSTSALTAPLLALTALTGDTLGAFTLEDGQRQVTDVLIGEASPAAGRTVAEVAARHRALVVAHRPAGEADRLLLEVDHGARLRPGDRLLVCGEPRDLAPLLADADDELIPGLLWAGWFRRTGRTVWRILMEVDLAVKVCGAILAAVALVSTLVFYIHAQSGDANHPRAKTLAHAVYRTVSVIATGGDMKGDEAPDELQYFFSFLRITGAILMAAFTAIFTSFLVRARLGGALEIRRIPDAGHIIVCGVGNVGFRVVEELHRAGERVVVIEVTRDSRFLATARRLGVAVIIGDATVLEVLRQAHAATARAVVAATDNELANLEIALLARELNPQQRVVVRLSDPPLAQTVREAANIRFALSIPVLAAPAFVAALFGDRVQSVFLVAGRLLAVVELTVQPDDPFLAARSVRALAVDYRLLPVGLVGADHSLRPQPLQQQLGPGDRLTVIAAMSDLERLLRREPVPPEWAVEVTEFQLASRPVVVEALRRYRGLGAEAAERLPVPVAGGLTRGQAEELIAALDHEGVRARAVQDTESRTAARV